MKLLPNILSGIRIILAIVFVGLFLQEELFWKTLSVAVFASAAVTDFFDGYIARTYGAESASGVFLDPLADKILTFSGFICLPFIDTDLFPWWGIVLIVSRDSLVTGLRVWADVRKIEIKTRFTAKIKTAIQMIFLYLILLADVFVASGLEWSGQIAYWLHHPGQYYIFIIIVLFTVYTGVEYILGNPQIFSKNKSDFKEQKP